MKKRNKTKKSAAEIEAKLAAEIKAINQPKSAADILRIAGIRQRIQN